MKRKNLLEAQLKMKRRLHGKKQAAPNAVCPVGLPRKRRALAPRQRNCRRFSGKRFGREDRGRVRIEGESFGQKHRERLCAGKAVVAHWIEVEDEFITNIPAGENEPTGKPWIYYMLARLVIVRRKETSRYRYVEVVQGETHDDVNDALLELITRPGIKWLEPSHLKEI